MKQHKTLTIEKWTIGSRAKDQDGFMSYGGCCTASRYAFPSYLSAQLNSDGMLLRDYFAAKAMQALISLELPNAEQLNDFEQKSYDDWISSGAYGMADAMLKARDEK